MNSDLRDATIARIGALFGSDMQIDSDRAMAQLLELGRNIGPAFGDELIDDNPGLLALAPTAARHYYNNITRHEFAEAEALLLRRGNGQFRYADVAQTFGKHNYDRVRDMFDVVDFQSCRQFVLIGCGPLPMTLYHVHDRTKVPELIAVDLNAASIDLVKRTAQAFSLARVATRETAGEAYDFSGADVIYVANLVRPKKEVLRRIADTAPRHAVIVLRDPYSLGRLLTERGADYVGDRYTVVRVTEPETAHFSRHVFLRLRA